MYSNVSKTSNTEDLLFHVPIWQIGLAPKNAHVIMQDLLSCEWFKNESLHILEFHHTIITCIMDLEFLLWDSRVQDVDTDHPWMAVIERVAKIIFIEQEQQQQKQRQQQQQKQKQCCPNVGDQPNLGTNNLHDSQVNDNQSNNKLKLLFNVLSHTATSCCAFASTNFCSNPDSHDDYTFTYTII